MKAKYEKMIDEYVKKHYGDLERGVLAPEVKYKVLFKLYRKKCKEKKIQVKMLRKLLKGGEEIESWGSDTCSGCEHYVPMHTAESKSLTQDAFVTPASCKLGKSMTACCPFYSVKVDEKKAQETLTDWLHDDITWCCRECSDTNCERNNRNRRCKEGLYSAADMFDPFKCPVDAELPKNNP